MAHNQPSALEGGSTLTAGCRENDTGTGIDQETYDNLVLYTKYASAAYQPICPRPMGNTLIGQQETINARRLLSLSEAVKKELPFSLVQKSGSSSATLADLAMLQTGIGLPPPHISSTSFESPERPHVHTGFLIAYQSIAQAMLDIVGTQINMHPMYAVTITGHSLGANHAQATPLTAALVEKMVDEKNVYRGVHSIGMVYGCVDYSKALIRSSEDGVPTMIPTSLGYQHHATEYWQFMELPAPEHVKRCRGSEDPEGSISIRIASSGVNPAHWVYFGQPIASDPRLSEYKRLEMNLKS
ncbi:hypothetical protein EDC04DRAFT_2610161 [Pisolithus marmoratus]|nr:hypothetical protein EDC04DRAFT_2610161 [Pisolithus marmoratus]